MPAPNIAYLYDFETAFEGALRNYFLNVNVGGFTFPQVLTPQTNAVTANFQTTPRLQIRAGSTGLAASGSGVQETAVTLANTATNYYSYYTLGVTLDVITSRSNTSQSHGLLRGAARQGMLSYTAAMNTTVLPYYEVTLVTPGSTTQAIDGDNDEIITSLAYSIDFWINPTVYPNS